MNLKKSIQFEKDESLIILLPEKDELIIELKGVRLIQNFKSQEKQTLEVLTKAIELGTSQQFSFLDGTILIENTAEKFEGYEFEVYAKSSPSVGGCRWTSNELNDDGLPFCHTN